MVVKILPPNKDTETDDCSTTEGEDESITTTTVQTELTFPFQFISPQDHQNILVEYMAAKQETMLRQLNPIYEKLPRLDAYHAFNFSFMTNPCGSRGCDTMDSCYECGFDSTNAIVSQDLDLIERNFNGGLISFGPVQVREYQRTVGDHPDVSDDGPPLALDWDYVEYKMIPLAEYEARKARKRHRRSVRREITLRQKQIERGVKHPRVDPLKNVEFYCPRIKGTTRFYLLHQEFEVPVDELERAELEVKRVAKQRDESVAQSGFSEKTEELLELAARRLKRSFSFGNRKKKSGNSNGSVSSIASSTSSFKNDSTEPTHRRSQSADMAIERMFKIGSVNHQ